MGKMISQEALALGVNQLFSPVVDLAREPRYGRVSEKEPQHTPLLELRIIQLDVP